MKKKYSFEELISMILYKMEELSEKLLSLEEKINSGLDAENYRLYSPQQVSEMLGVNKGTVLGWIKNNKLHPLREEGQYYKVTGIEIKRFLSKSKRYSKAEFSKGEGNLMVKNRKKKSDYIYQIEVPEKFDGNDYEHWKKDNLM